MGIFEDQVRGLLQTNQRETFNGKIKKKKNQFTQVHFNPFSILIIFTGINDIHTNTH